MKTRYKIMIIVIIAFIPMSFFFPQVFLVFHLDKFEISDECNSLQERWDWYDNTCDRIHNISEEAPTCESLGGRNTCEDICGEDRYYNPWRGLDWGCIQPCYNSCEFGYTSLVPCEHNNDEISVGDFQITSSTPKWKIPDELSKMGCTDAMIIHLKRYSNVFNEKWNDEHVILESISLPWGVHQYALDECMQKVSELRNNELYGCNENEVYHSGICMTLETKEKSLTIGEIENEN